MVSHEYGLVVASVGCVNVGVVALVVHLVQWPSQCEMTVLYLCHC